MLRYSKRGRHSDEDVQLFMSTSGMNSETTQGRKGRQPRPELDREYSDLTKAKHEQIVKTLLDEFDLEETKEKYRGSQQKVSYVPKSKGLSNFQFRSELRRLMGSEVIYLNDRKWNEELENRLHEEFEKRQDRHEEALAEAEVMRIRKLKLDGIISLTEDDVEESENSRRKEKEKSKGKRRKRKRSQSPQNNKRCSSAPSRPVTWHKPPEHVSTQVELMEDSASEKENCVNDDVSPRQERTNSDKNIQEAKRPHFQEQKTQQKPKKQVPEEIQELYNEESVDGLYSMAEKLVIADTSSKVKTKGQSSKG